MPNWLKATLACGLACLFITPLISLFVGAGAVVLIFMGAGKIDVFAKDFLDS